MKATVLKRAVFLLTMAVMLLASAGCASGPEIRAEEQAEWTVPEGLGYSPLQFAVLRDDLRAIQALLKAGAPVDARDEEGRTALHFAAGSGQLKATQLLLDAGAAPNIVDNVGFTPFLASAGGNGVVAELLIQCDAKLASAHLKNGTTAAHLAARGGVVSLLSILQGMGLPLDAANDNGDRPLQYAACYNQCNALKLLIANGARVRAVGKRGTALTRAVYMGHVQAAKVLLDAGASPHELITAVDCYRKECRPALVQLLIQHGADPDRGHSGLYEYASLHLACMRGETELARMLLAAGANTEINCKKGQTALHKAAAAGHAEVVVLLEDYGADQRAIDGLKRTPRDRAVAAGHEDIAAMLK